MAIRAELILFPWLFIYKGFNGHPCLFSSSSSLLHPLKEDWTFLSRYVLLVKPDSTNWNNLERLRKERASIIILQKWMGGKPWGLSCAVSERPLCPGLGSRGWIHTWCFVQCCASCWPQTRLRLKPATKPVCLGNVWTDRVCVIEDGLGISVSTATADSSEYSDLMCSGSAS